MAEYHILGGFHRIPGVDHQFGKISLGWLHPIGSREKWRGAPAKIAGVFPVNYGVFFVFGVIFIQKFWFDILLETGPRSVPGRPCFFQF
jgi:hypothetical protein